MSTTVRHFRARQAMGRIVRGPALVAHDGFSARYDLDRISGIFSRPTHKLAGGGHSCEAGDGPMRVCLREALELPGKAGCLPICPC